MDFGEDIITKNHEKIYEFLYKEKLMYLDVKKSSNKQAKKIFIFLIF